MFWQSTVSNIGLFVPDFANLIKLRLHVTASTSDENYFLQSNFALSTDCAVTHLFCLESIMTIFYSQMTRPAVSTSKVQLQILKAIYICFIAVRNHRPLTSIALKVRRKLRINDCESNPLAITLAGLSPKGSHTCIYAQKLQVIKSLRIIWLAGILLVVSKDVLGQSNHSVVDKIGCIMLPL